MKLLLFLLFSPLLASAQKDFDYSLTFTKCTTITQLSLTKGDTAVKQAEFIAVKRGNKLEVFSGGGPVRSYPILYRGVKNGILIYMDGIKDINVNPLGPVLYIKDGDKTYLYQ